jgi:hypothetical protein
MRERLSWLFIDSQTNNTQDGPFLHKYASPFWPQKLSKTVSIKGEGLLLASHPSLFSNYARHLFNPENHHCPAILPAAARY